MGRAKVQSKKNHGIDQTQNHCKDQEPKSKSHAHRLKHLKCWTNSDAEKRAPKDASLVNNAKVLSLGAFLGWSFFRRSLGSDLLGHRLLYRRCFHHNDLLGRCCLLRGSGLCGGGLHRNSLLRCHGRCCGFCDNLGRSDLFPRDALLRWTRLTTITLWSAAYRYVSYFVRQAHRLCLCSSCQFCGCKGFL